MVSDSWPLVGTQDSRGLIHCDHRPYMVKACGNSNAEAEVFNLLICETLAFCLTENIFQNQIQMLSITMYLYIHINVEAKAI